MGRLSSVLATLRTIFATSDLDLQGACGVTPVVVVCMPGLFRIFGAFQVPSRPDIGLSEHDSLAPGHSTFCCHAKIVLCQNVKW